MDLLDVNMPEEVTINSVENQSFEERLSLIKIVSLPLPSSCENNEPAANDHEVEKSSDVNNEETKNVGVFLSMQLDLKRIL